MLQSISKWLMQWFMSLGLESEAALAATIFMFFVGTLILVIIADKLMKTRLCRPLRRRIEKAYTEDDTYDSPDTEG